MHQRILEIDLHTDKVRPKAAQKRGADRSLSLPLLRPSATLEPPQILGLFPAPRQGNRGAVHDNLGRPQV